MRPLSQALFSAVGGPRGVLDGRFEILREAGVGGMGTVYLATDLQQQREVAVKVMKSFSAAAAQRFLQEATALSRLHHPSIVGYVAHGETSEGEAYLAMEWLAGESLGRRLEAGRLELKETVELGRQIADALAYAHERGVIHRDLKPSNLFIHTATAPQTIKILDFGIARLTDSDTDITRTGELVGTPGYLAPEQARGAKDLGPRADLFSLGCVLYRCATGERAFGGEDVLSVLAKLILYEPPRARSLRAEIPNRLDTLIMQLLEKSPANRPASAAVVRDELDCILSALARGEQEPATPSSEGPAPIEPDCVILARPVGQGRHFTEEDVHAATQRVEELGGTLQLLAGGAVVATLWQARLDAVAGCTRAITSLLPQGAAAVMFRAPNTQLLDGAGELLHDAPPHSIHIGKTSAEVDVALLEAKLQVEGFEIHRAGTGSRPVSPGAPAPATLASGSPWPETKKSSAQTGSAKWALWLSVGAAAAILLSILLWAVRSKQPPAPNVATVRAYDEAPAPRFLTSVSTPARERAVALALHNNEAYLATELGEDLTFGQERSPGSGKRGQIDAFTGNTKQWSVALSGGPGGVSIRALAAGPAGIFVAGFFYELIEAAGVRGRASWGSEGLFIVEIGLDGKVAGVRVFGGPGFDFFLGRLSITLGSSGDLILAGAYGGSLELGCGAHVTEDGQDAFIAALRRDGSCRWMRRLGDQKLQAFEWVGVELGGDIVAAGEMSGTVRFGEQSYESSGGIDVMVARLRADGTPRWLNHYGDSTRLQGSVRGAAIPLGGAVLAGWFDGKVDFGGGALSSTDGQDLFVARLDANGKHVASRTIDVQRARCPAEACILDQIGVAADADGKVVVALPFEGSLRIDDVRLTARGGTDLALLKLDLDPDADQSVVWVKQLGDDNASCEPPSCVLTAAHGRTDVGVAGAFSGSLDFNPSGSSRASFRLESSGTDAFFVLLPP